MRQGFLIAAILTFLPMGGFTMFFKGVGALLLSLSLFSVFSMKCPKGDKAMSGLANAAITTFLVEAICKYILGDFAGIEFFRNVGTASGNLGGSAAAVLVGISMGTDPVMAVASGMALREFGILPGFIAGYLLHFLLYGIRKLPDGIKTIAGALLAAASAHGIAAFINPGVTAVIGIIGDAIIAATNQAPLMMGMLLGGIMKIVCTSPLSSMALTAMLQLTGLPMGIAAIACFGGSFTNGMMFWKLGLGDGGRIAAVMLEPLTQADIITKNPVPVYFSNFFGGGFSGIVAAYLGIICNAPGTASPIPGMFAPFAFNAPDKVLAALLGAAICGTLSGLASSVLFRFLDDRGIRSYRRAESLT